MKILTILTQKGGVGKSTVAINLAVAAHLNGKTTVIADLDDQRSAKLWHEARLRNDADPMPHVQKVNVNALPGFIAECEKQSVDFLILDTPPKADKEGIAAAEQADLIFMVSSPSPMDLRAMGDTIRLVSLTSLKPGTPVKLILNKMRPLGSSAVEAAQVLRELNVDVLPLGFGNRVDFEYSLIEGLSALEYEPEGQAAKETQSLYKETCKLVNMKTPKRKGETTHGKVKARA